MSLASELKEYAVEHGVDLIGVTSAEPFMRKKVDGLDEPLIDPRTYLENAKSVVVYAFYHGGPLTEPSRPGALHGRLSPGFRAIPAMDKYCYEIIKGYLNKKGYKVVIQCDSSCNLTEIATKPLAVKAGIGVYGKNSLVHAQGFGSWIELGGCVITDAPLEVEDRSYKLSDCGDCTACMEACPTGAIKEPYKVTPSLCITEWLDGAPIPRELREKVGNELNSCEICQEVCPKNRGLRPREHYPIEMEEKSETPELIPLLLGDENYYKTALPSFTLLLLPDVSTLRRNVALVLGNIRDPIAVPALIQALGYPEPKVRSYVAWALGRIGGRKAREALAQAFNYEVDLEAKEEIEAALQECSKAYYSNLE
jgi:epoxyqueuosine reductase